MATDTSATPVPAAPAVEARKPPAKAPAKAAAKAHAKAASKARAAKAPKAARAAKPKAPAKVVKAAAPRPAATKPVVKASAPKPAAPKAAAPKAAAPKAAPKADKPKKPKLVRDSFTIPKAEYAVLEELKARAAKLGRPAKKSEVLRAGLKALVVMSDSALATCLQSVPAIKTGRPAKD